MGLNTTVLILNDALSDIKKDKDFGQKIYDNINQGKKNIRSGSSANAANVLATHHADFSLLLAVGGNCGSVLAHIYDSKHNTEETQVKLLRELAAQLGYTISKRRT